MKTWVPQLQPDAAKAMSIQNNGRPCAAAQGRARGTCSPTPLSGTLGRQRPPRRLSPSAEVSNRHPQRRRKGLGEEGRGLTACAEGFLGG